MTPDLVFDQSAWAFSPFIIPAIAAAIKGVGSLLGKKSKDKKEDAAASEMHRSAQATHGQSEASRTAALRTLQAALGGRGINLPIDPVAMQEKPYVGADPRKVAEAGRGSSFWSSLLGGAGDLGLAFGQSQMMNAPTSAGQPVGAAGSGFDVDQISRMAAEAGVGADDVSELLAEMLRDRQRAPAPRG